MSEKNWLDYFCKTGFGFGIIVQEGQQEEGILTQNNFVRREEGRGTGL